MIQAAVNAAADSGLRFIEASETTFPETSDLESLAEEREEILKAISGIRWSD